MGALKIRQTNAEVNRRTKAAYRRMRTAVAPHITLVIIDGKPVGALVDRNAYDRFKGSCGLNLDGAELIDLPLGI